MSTLVPYTPLLLSRAWSRLDLPWPSLRSGQTHSTIASRVAPLSPARATTPSTSAVLRVGMVTAAPAGVARVRPPSRDRAMTPPSSLGKGLPGASLRKFPDAATDPLGLSRRPGAEDRQSTRLNSR